MSTYALELKDDQLVIALSGEFDTAAATRVHEELKDFKNKQIKKVIFEMGNASFIASSGLRVMFFARTLVEGIQVDIIGAKGLVLKVLEMSGVGRFMTIKTAE